MSEENDVADISNQQMDEAPEASNEEGNDEQEEGESIAEYKARLAKAQELINNYKIRAEKAERANKGKPESAPKRESQQELGSKDLMSLMQAGVTADDVDDVLEIAKLKKISVQEALKLGLTKTILAEKAEYRKTAEVSNTAPARKGSTKVSDEVLVSNLMKGDIPEKGSEEAMRLFYARRGGKR